MKNRTVIGLICIAAAAAAAFGLAPALAGNAAAETVAVRAVNRIPAGTLIEEDDVETVALGAQNLPAGLPAPVPSRRAKDRQQTGRRRRGFRPSPRNARAA